MNLVEFIMHRRYIYPIMDSEWTIVLFYFVFFSLFKRAACALRVLYSL